jgi:hypothetical protein
MHNKVLSDSIRIEIYILTKAFNSTSQQGDFRYCGREAGQIFLSKEEG